MRKTHSPKEDRSWTQEQQYTLTFQQTCLYQGKKYASDTHKEERQEKEEEPDQEKTVTKSGGEVTMWKKKSNALCTE